MRERRSLALLLLPALRPRRRARAHGRELNSPRAAPLAPPPRTAPWPPWPRAQSHVAAPLLRRSRLRRPRPALRRPGLPESRAPSSAGPRAVSPRRGHRPSSPPPVKRRRAPSVPPPLLAVELHLPPSPWPRQPTHELPQAPVILLGPSLPRAGCRSAAAAVDRRRRPLSSPTRPFRSPQFAPKPSPR